MATTDQRPAEIPEGLSETPWGLRWYSPGLRLLFEITDLHRKSGELWGEISIKCALAGVRQISPDGRLRQGNFNFSSIVTRQSWAKALALMTPAELNATLDWGNIMERVCQDTLDHEKNGTVKGGLITGGRIGPQGRPWAAWPILPHGETGTIFARGGAGKTGLVATLAFSMALGRSLVPGVRIDRRYRVAVLDWETNPETANDLWGLIAETHGVPVPDGVWYEPMDAPLERSFNKVASVLARSKADLVIIDSVAMAMLSSGDYSDPSESITRIYQSLRKLGTWGLLIDHVAGNDLRGKRVAMKAYGSIFKLNLARHAITLHIGNRAGDTSQAYLVCPKSNIGRDRWAMPGVVTRNDTEFRWSFGEPDYDLYDRLMSQSDDEDEQHPEEALATPRQADLYLAALYDAYPGGMTVAQVREEVGASTVPYVRKVMNALQRDGMVRATDGPGPTREKVWLLTETGISIYTAKGK